MVLLERRSVLGVALLLVSAGASECRGTRLEISVEEESSSSSSRRYEVFEKRSDEWRLASEGLAPAEACTDACFKVNVYGETFAKTTLAVDGRTTDCLDRDCFFTGCGQDDVALRKLDFDTESPDDASARMLKVFDKVRRLTTAYSYDFDCTSSLDECLDDSQCSADELCFFATRKKRALREKIEEEDKRRQLLFGSNTVGQCICG
mmetsp:Transcript_28158/g.90769  ORF Transcript_28158/g.90769 Transcript_28158/m.90769 type:complete len:206 (-) Transcript_28158:102-719(-)